MDKQFREAIDRSLEELKDIQEKVDSFIDDLPDDGEEIKSAAKKTLGQINELINKAFEKAGEQADEAQLQAHLGLKEAQDKLEASKAVVDDYMSRTGEESKRLLDEIQLKQHLAAMEAKDFWETRGQKMAEELKESTSSFQDAAVRAADELQQAFKQWNDQFRR